MGIEAVIMIIFAVLLSAVAIRIMIYSIKYIYVMAPSILAWVFLVGLMHWGGVFDTKKGLEESYDANHIESVEDQSKRDRGSE